MRKEWLIYAVVGIALLALLFGLSFWSGDSIPVHGNLKVEAEGKAREYIERTVTRCGDGDYTVARWAERFHGNLVQQWALFQLKSPSPIVKETPLTPADELNGVEWRGTVDILAVAHRRYDESTRRWSEWRDGVPERMSMRETAMPSLIGLADAAFYKQNGRWSTDEMSDLFVERKPDCSKIPPG